MGKREGEKTDPNSSVWKAQGQMDRGMDGCPASLQIHSNRLDYLSRATQHHGVNQKRAATL